MRLLFCIAASAVVFSLLAPGPARAHSARGPYGAESVDLVARLAVEGEPPPLPAGVTELQFGEFFRDARGAPRPRVHGASQVPRRPPGSHRGLRGGERRAFPGTIHPLPVPHHAGHGSRRARGRPATGACLCWHCRRHTPRSISHRCRCRSWSRGHCALAPSRRPIRASPGCASRWIRPTRDSGPVSHTQASRRIPAITSMHERRTRDEERIAAQRGHRAGHRGVIAAIVPAQAAPRVTRLTPPSELFSSGRADPIIARFLPGQRFDLQATVQPDAGQVILRYGSSMSTASVSPTA